MTATVITFLVLLRRLGAAAVLADLPSAIGSTYPTSGPFGGFEATWPDLYRFTRHGRTTFLSPSESSYCNDFDSIHATRSSATAEVVLGGVPKGTDPKYPAPLRAATAAETEIRATSRVENQAKTDFQNSVATTFAASAAERRNGDDRCPVVGLIMSFGIPESGFRRLY